MSLMMQRRAGNRFPDSDRGVPGRALRETSSSAAERVPLDRP